MEGKVIKIVKSPIYRTGSKANTLKSILPLFPKGIKTFYDMFGGSGVVGMNVNAERKVYHEIDSITYGIVEYLKNTDVEEVVSTFEFLKKLYYDGDEKEFFYSLRNLYNITKSYNVLWFTSFMAFSNKLTFNKKGELNSSFGKRMSLEKLKHIDNFDDIEISNEDYRIHLFTKFDERDFVFLDPPYYLSEMNSVSSYSSKWNEKDERSFLAFLNILYDNDIKFGVTNLISYKGKEHSKLIELIEELSLNVKVIKTSNNANGIVNDDYKEVYIYNYEAE